MLTLSSALDRCQRYYANNLAVSDPEGRWTWEQHLDRVTRLGGALQALGVKQGSTFGTLSRNTFRNFELLHAGYWMGAIPVPVTTHPLTLRRPAMCPSGSGVGVRR